VAFVNCDDVTQGITPPIAAKNHFLLADFSIPIARPDLDYFRFAVYNRPIL
jgi:hypothetical protein